MKKYYYHQRRSCAQSGAGGGALKVRIPMLDCQMARICEGFIEGPASNTTLTMKIYDEDGQEQCNVVSKAAAANNTINIPADITHPDDMIIPAKGYVEFETGAAAQTETLIVAIGMWISRNVEPTWATTGSGGTPSLAPPSISTSSRMVLVDNIA